MRAAQPTQPFRASRVYVSNNDHSFFYYVCAYRLGRLGRLGEANSGAGFQNPTSNSDGWAGCPGSGADSGIPLSAQCWRKPEPFSDTRRACWNPSMASWNLRRASSNLRRPRSSGSRNEAVDRYPDLVSGQAKAHITQDATRPAPIDLAGPFLVRAIAGSTAARLHEIQITAFGSSERVEGFTVETTQDVFVTAAEYARLRGVDQTYIRQLRLTGRLVTDGSGLIAVHASDKLVASTRLRRPRAGSAGARPGHPWGGKFEARRTLRGSDLKKLSSSVAAVLTDAANRLAPRVAAANDPADCRSLLCQEFGRTTRQLVRLLTDSDPTAGPSGRTHSHGESHE